MPLAKQEPSSSVAPKCHAEGRQGEVQQCDGDEAGLLNMDTSCLPSSRTAALRRRQPSSAHLPASQLSREEDQPSWENFYRQALLQCPQSRALLFFGNAFSVAFIPDFLKCSAHGFFPLLLGAGCRWQNRSRLPAWRQSAMQKEGNARCSNAMRTKPAC